MCTKVGSNSKIWSIQTVPFIFLFEVLRLLSRLRETKLTSFLLCNQAFLCMEEGRNSTETYGRMESEEHYVCHCAVFYEIRGTYHCLFKQVFGPLCKVMEFED